MLRRISEGAGPQGASPLPHLSLAAKMRLEDASRTLARALAMAEGLAPSREDSLFPRTSPPANALRRARTDRRRIPCSMRTENP